MATKSTENLFKLSDTDVISTIRSTFTDQLKASSGVKSVFFPNAANPARQAVNASWTNNVAIALVCSSIGGSSMYGFSKTVDRAKATAYWQRALQLGDSNAIAASQDLYGWAFPSYCQADGLHFSDYLNDNPANWGGQLATAITETSFVNTTVAKIIAGDPNWLKTLNLAFYKVHRLKPDAVNGVVSAWAKAFPEKGIVANWQTYNFVPSNLFSADQFISAVNSAITNDETVLPSYGNPQSMNLIYGKKTQDFVDTQAKALGLSTGKNPNNYVTKTASGCFVKGTTIHLADRTTIPIETVQEGDRVLGQDGQIGIHSDEKVVQELAHPIQIYGFNEEIPFFTGNHPFWTQEGWKAIDPEGAMKENPNRKVGQLQVGDRVLKLTSIQTLDYEEVCIERITTTVLAAGETVHGQHFSHGASAYHANGYLVAVNYPQITAARIMKGLAKLSLAERKVIAETLEPVLPMLSYALGDFIEDPIRAGLAQ